MIPAEITNLYLSQSMLCVDEIVDSDLAAVFHTLQYTTILFNKHYYTQTPIKGALLQECLGFVQSRLIAIDGQPKDELSECLHLAMMAFFATTFRLPGQYEHPCCTSLASRLQASYTAAHASIVNLPDSISIWLMFVCLVSADNRHELYSWPRWQEIAARGLSWEEIWAQLKQVMWIDTFHDDLGRRTFEALMTRFGPSDVDECDRGRL